MGNIFVTFISLVLMLLMVMSSCAYAIGFFILLMRRSIPDEVAIARIAVFSALVLVAAKSLSPPTLALSLGSVSIFSFSPQLPLSFLVAGCALYAVYKLMQVVTNAFNVREETRIVLHNWLALIIPPIASIGLLGIFDAVPDQDHSALIYAFVVVNSVPAVYAMINAKRLLGLRKFGRS